MESVKAWSRAGRRCPLTNHLRQTRIRCSSRRVSIREAAERCIPCPSSIALPRRHDDRVWQALHIENEFLRVMILPEIGGRIHAGLDKTNGYDFFYRQNVIKPALVGLAGPWISGGVEFNWPQHHRPATFMPVNYDIEEHADGSRTIWCSDHDPMNRHERNAWRVPSSRPRLCRDQSQAL